MDFAELTHYASSASGVILARDLVTGGLDPWMIRSAVREGVLIRVRRGAYVESITWNVLSPLQRYRKVVAAHSLVTGSGAILSHQSAAACWGIPIIGAWPALVHETVPRAGGGRSTPGVVRHTGEVSSPYRTSSGQPVTGVARTVIDLARTTSFLSAVASMDFALRLRSAGRAPMTSKEELYEEFARMSPFRGAVAVRRVLEFADGLAGSVGESLSRVRAHEFGFPLPQLQVAFTDSQGTMIVDFWWPEFNLIGEFDGLVKYHRPEYLSGRTIEEVVVKEKLREDRLRRLGPSVARWTWREAFEGQPMRRILIDAGLPCR